MLAKETAHEFESLRQNVPLPLWLPLTGRGVVHRGHHRGLVLKCAHERLATNSGPHTLGGWTGTNDQEDFSFDEKCTTAPRRLDLFLICR